MDSSFPSYKGFVLKGQRKSEETYNGKKFNNQVIIIILSVCLLWSTSNFFCMFECTSRTRTLSMFECIMFALWVWEQRNPIARTIENRDANPPYATAQPRNGHKPKFQCLNNPNGTHGYYSSF